MTLRGTCPACFRDMPVVQERKYGFAQPATQIGIGRHGWQEQGGRQVAVYNKAWHEGECYGVGWLPFEISPEGTEHYVEHRLFPAALIREKSLSHLATKPVITHRQSTRAYSPEDRKNIDCPYEVRLRPGDPEVKSSYDYAVSFTIPGVPSYDNALAALVAQVKAERDAICREGRDCCERIAKWERGEIRDEERVPTVHFKSSGGRLPRCGSRSRGLFTTESENKATCSRCQKGLASDAAYVAARNAVAADADTLVAWLKKLGKPATVAEIKKGLGWDAKRFNAAYDKTDRYGNDPSKGARVERSWTTPTRYSIPLTKRESLT